MKRFFLFLFVLMSAMRLGHPTAAQGRFIGDFLLTPVLNAIDGREKRLKNNFGFIDPNNVAWEAKAGLLTDGASIPDWAQGMIGGRYDAQYLKAAVLHDHYCDRRVRTWEDTHRMFYHAMKAQGVPEAKAAVMYYAVYNFGPRWQILRRGERCATGKNCTRSGGDSVTETIQRARPARFRDEKAIANQLAKLEAEIEAGREQPTADAIEARAKRENPDDVFYREPALIDRTVIVE